MKYKFLALSFLLTLIYSCIDSELCKESTESYCYFGFYNQESEEKAAIDSLFFHTYPWLNDTIYQTKANPVGIQLNSEADSTGFVFNIYKADTIIADTLVLHHSSFLSLISYNCGFTYKFVIEEAHSNAGDFNSVEILNKEVYNYEVEHIRIYY